MHFRHNWPSSLWPKPHNILIRITFLPTLNTHLDFYSCNQLYWALTYYENTSIGEVQKNLCIFAFNVVKTEWLCLHVCGETYCKHIGSGQKYLNPTQKNSISKMNKFSSSSFQLKSADCPDIFGHVIIVFFYTFANVCNITIRIAKIKQTILNFCFTCQPLIYIPSDWTCWVVKKATEVKHTNTHTHIRYR